MLNPQLRLQSSRCFNSSFEALVVESSLSLSKVSISSLGFFIQGQGLCKEQRLRFGSGAHTLTLALFSCFA